MVAMWLHIVDPCQNEVAQVRTESVTSVSDMTTIEHWNNYANELEVPACLIDVLNKLASTRYMKYTYMSIANTLMVYNIMIYSCLVTFVYS